MSAQARSGERAEAPARMLERVLPAGPPAPVAELVRWMGLWERAGEERPRPHVMLNMVSTLDGRATLSGHSGPISSRVDRELFHALRAAVDGVLVGAGTIRAERYGRMIRDAAVRDERIARGMTEEPLACIVSGRLELPDDIALLQTEDARVAVATASQASLPPVAAQVTYLRTVREGRLDLPAALAELRSDYGVRSLLCEGGPHLARELFGENLVDELFLSLSPLLAGGEPTAGEALRILAGVELEPPARVELTGVLREGSLAVPALQGRLGGARLTGDDLEQLAGELAALDGDPRGGRDADDNLLPVELLERDPGSLAQRRLQLALEDLLQVPGVMPARRRARRFTPSGSRRGSTATFSTTLLGTMIESSPVAKVVYSSPSELTVPSKRPRQRSALQPHALAHAERAGAEQDGPGEQVAERLLRRQPQDHRREGAAEGERVGFDASHPQRHDHRHQDGHEAHQEADGAGRRGVQPPEQRRSEHAPERARDRPAEDHQGTRPRSLSRWFPAPVPGPCGRGGRGGPRGSCRAGSRGCRRRRPRATNSGTSSATSRRARLTARRSSWRMRPTSRQAWLRVSNIFCGVLGIGTGVQ